MKAVPSTRYPPFHSTEKLVSVSSIWIGRGTLSCAMRVARRSSVSNSHASLAVDDAAELQAAADRLSPHIIRKQLNYWTLILGPKFSKKGTGTNVPVAFLLHRATRG